MFSFGLKSEQLITHIIMFHTDKCICSEIFLRRVNNSINRYSLTATGSLVPDRKPDIFMYHKVRVGLYFRYVLIANL